MDPKSPDDRPEAAAPQPLEWRFAQVFGERGAGEDVQEGKAAAAPVLSLLVWRLARSTQFRWWGFDAAATPEGRAFHSRDAGIS